MRFIFHNILLVIFSVSSLVQADEIDPIDDENLGYFRINLPSGGNVLRPYLLYADSGAAINDYLVPKKLYRVRETSAGELSLNFTGISSWLKQKIQVNKGQTTDINLGLFNAEWDGEKTKVDLGPDSTLRVNFFQTNIKNTGVRTGNLFKESRAPFFPGDIHLSFFPPQLGAYSYTIKENDDLTAQIELPDVRSKITLVNPKVVYPDAMGSEACQDNFNYVVQRSQSYSGEINVPVNDNNFSASKDGNVVSFYKFQLNKSLETTVKYFPEITPGKELLYDLVLSNISYPLTLKAGEEKRIEVKRIDVNDVLITRENGTTYFVPGIYSVWRKAADGNWLPILGWNLDKGWNCKKGISTQRFSTKTGLYVLPGEYKVSVHYFTDEMPREQSKVFYLKL